MRFLPSEMLKKPEIIRLFLRAQPHNAQSPILAYHYKDIEGYRMKKTIRNKCWFCGRDFIIRDGREWKYLCRQCFHYVYEILEVQERPLELRHNWKRIIRQAYADKPQYFPEILVERLTSVGVLAKG